MPSPSERPLFKLQVPWYWRLLLVAFAVGVGYWIAVEGDTTVRVIGALSLLVCAPFAVYYGFLLHHTVSERGITEWRWRGPGRGHRAVASFAWADIRAVWLFDSGSLGAVQFRIEGETDGESHTMYVPSYSGPASEAVRYLIGRTDDEVAVSDAVTNHLARRAAV